MNKAVVKKYDKKQSKYSLIVNFQIFSFGEETPEKGIKYMDLS